MRDRAVTINGSNDDFDWRCLFAGLPPQRGPVQLPGGVRAVGRADALVLVADTQPQRPCSQLLCQVGDVEILYETRLDSFEFTQRQQVGHRGDRCDNSDSWFRRGKVKRTESTSRSSTGRQAGRVAVAFRDEEIEYLPATFYKRPDQIVSLFDAVRPTPQIFRFLRESTVTMAGWVESHVEPAVARQVFACSGVDPLAIHVGDRSREDKQRGRGCGWFFAKQAKSHSSCSGEDTHGWFVCILRDCERGEAPEIAGGGEQEWESSAGCHVIGFPGAA